MTEPPNPGPQAAGPPSAGPPGGYWSPSQGGYPVPPGGAYPTPPPGGYAYPVPPQMQFPVSDPLISPDYPGWWNRSVSIVKQGLRPLVQLQAIGLIPALALQVPIEIYVGFVTRDFPDGAQARVEPAQWAGLFAGLGLNILAVFVGILVAAVVTIASIHVCVTVAVGGRPRVGAALRGAVGRVLPLLGWQVLAGLLVLAGLIACVLPGIYLLAVFLVLPAVVAFERGGAIGRCFRLFHGDLGSSIARIATLVGLSVGVGVIAAVVGGILAAMVTAGVGGDAGLVVGSALATVVSVVLVSAVAVVTATLTLTAYADMRARIEPLSTGVLAHELGLTRPTP